MEGWFFRAVALARIRAKFTFSTIFYPMFIFLLSSPPPAPPVSRAESAHTHPHTHTHNNPHSHTVLYRQPLRYRVKLLWSSKSSFVLNVKGEHSLLTFINYLLQIKLNFPKEIERERERERGWISLENENDRHDK